MTFGNVLFQLHLSCGFITVYPKLSTILEDQREIFKLRIVLILVQRRLLEDTILLMVVPEHKIHYSAAQEPRFPPNNERPNMLGLVMETPTLFNS